MRRERFIAGNWKMNKGASESLEFLRKLSVLLEQGEDIPDNVNMALFPQAVNIIPMADHIRSSGVNVLLGIQNIHCKPSGAFTGENSIPCAIEAGAKLALVGHSERR
ncbi:MAG TPA: triose-phosphate isomerase, partial [Synergistales bacterium]|nr:triose-phosphate isomerase [Synergistales bacterium]